MERTKIIQITDTEVCLDAVFGKEGKGAHKMLWLILLIGIIVRSAIGLSPFSGMLNSEPPEG